MILADIQRLTISFYICIYKRLYRIIKEGANTGNERWIREELMLSFPIERYWEICKEYQQMSVDHGDRTLAHSHAGVYLYDILPGIGIYDIINEEWYSVPFVHERPARWGERYDGRPRQPDRAG